MDKDQTLPEVKRTSAGQFPSGQSGNPKGRPRGIVDKRVRYKALFEKHGEALAQKAVALALEGDTTALRLCLERVAPPLKARDLPVPLEFLASSDNLSRQGREVLHAISRGQISPDQAEGLFRSLTAQARITELSELDKRIEALERATF